MNESPGADLRSTSDVARRRTEERLALAFASARLGAWEYEIATRSLTASVQCKANHGLGPDDDLQLDTVILPSIAVEYRQRFSDTVDRAIASNGAFEIEVPIIWPDGTDHWLFVAGKMADETCMVGVTRDVTERHQVEQALRQSERRYRDIVEAANEGIWQLDDQARITFVNEQMADLIGSSPAAMLGRRKWDFVFPEDVAAMQALFERRRRGIEEEVVDIRFRHADGHEVWTLMAARPRFDDAGRFSGALDLFTDITERRRAEQALRDSEEQLRAADRLKDEFLAVVAHELKGPLAPIMMAVRLLQLKGPDVPELRKLRETIYRQTVQLSKLVNDLLDIGRIIAGKLHVDATRVELGSVVQQAVEISAPLIEKRRHALGLHLPAAPIYLQADETRLVQVVSNLLSNAAKYMQDGGRIDLAVLEEEGSAVIRVRDEGVGIAPEMLDRIFQRFVQVGASRRLAEGGLGIGLSLVKAVVEAHGGSVEAHSEGVGRGSVFTVRVPMSTPAPVAGPPAEFVSS
jgi:PAS domain S-box-containing protein